MSARDTLKAIAVERDKLTEKIRDAIQEGALEIFEKYPSVKSFGWKQYTPSWNDGDPCTLHVNYEYGELLINGGNEDSGEEYDEDEDGEPMEPNAKEVKAVDKAVTALLKNVSDGDFEELFGDNVIVTVTKDGITTEDYDCGR